MTAKNISDIEKILGYSFKNKMLLEESLTHPSLFRSRNEDKLFNYERLEFLGDSVLGLIIAEMLMHKYPNDKEGALAKRQSALVRGESIAKVARKLNIGKYIKMTPGEESTGGRNNSRNMENTAEAIIGAIYQDGGLESARDFILNHWNDLVSDMKSPPKDSKTTLQEWAQGKGFSIPKYEAIEITGPSHSPLFTVRVTIDGFEPSVAEAQGESKKNAEKVAAENLLKIIEEKKLM